jgi:hypothetical protein
MSRIRIADIVPEKGFWYRRQYIKPGAAIQVKLSASTTIHKTVHEIVSFRILKDVDSKRSTDIDKYINSEVYIAVKSKLGYLTELKEISF